MEIFDNIQTLLFNYNAVINSYNIRHNYLVNISNFLNMVIDFNYIKIDYLDNIITLLENNVENILTNMSIYIGESNIITTLKLYNLSTNITLPNGNVLTNNDMSILLKLKKQIKKNNCSTIKFSRYEIGRVYASYKKLSLGIIIIA
jgi:hypothetical protein